MAELWLFNWFQNGGRRHLGFLHYVNFDGTSDCWTPFSIYVSNLVQMRAIMAKLWPKMWFSRFRPNSPNPNILSLTPSLNLSLALTLFLTPTYRHSASWEVTDFQYGGRRHLGFCWIRFLRTRVVERRYSWCLYQIWCESVQKWRSYGRLTDFKMAAAAILNCCLVTLDHPRSLLHGPNIVLKLRFSPFRDMAIWTFCKFGLNAYSRPKIYVFFGGGLTRKHYFSSSRLTKGT